MGAFSSFLGKSADEQGSCRASSIKAVLIRSVGVTANVLATTPAVIPAIRFRRGESVPVLGYLKASLMLSNEMNRMASLATVPATSVSHPLYSARGPSLAITCLITLKGLRVGLSSCSWTRVLANSNAV